MPSQSDGNKRAACSATLSMTSNLTVMHERFGDVEALELRETPEKSLTDSQVRITVAVAGLNPVDWQIVESAELAEMFGISTPSGFGNDFSGVVSEIGSKVTRWRVGDRVFGGARGAAVATSIVLDENHRSLRRTPASISDLDAAVLDIAGRTASAVADALAAQPGETVLVGAAAGGVGSILTQLLVRAGARVIGTGSESSFEYLRSLGAEPVTYSGDLAGQVAKLAKGPIAAAADLYGTQAALAALQLGTPAERIVTIESDDPPTGVRAIGGADARPSAIDELTGLIAAGELRVPIAAVYQLSQFTEAVAFQRSRHAHGKVVIEIKH